MGWIRKSLTHPYTTSKWLAGQYRRPNDYLLATMQSSGTHWVRFLIAKAIVDHFDLDYEFENIHPFEIVPGFSLDPENRFSYNECPEIPRVQHTHLPYQFPYTVIFHNKPVIVLIRDLRDALISHYRKLVAGGDSRTFVDFLVDPDDEIKRRSVAGTLSGRVRFLNTWGAYIERGGRVLVIRYEELKKKTLPTLANVLSFLGIEEVSNPFLEGVVDFCSLTNMKRIGEQAAKRGTYRKGKAQELLSVNKGGVGYYHEEGFEPNAEAYFTAYVRQHLLHRFGYRY